MQMLPPTAKFDVHIKYKHMGIEFHAMNQG
jgi:hypothetical protein